MRIDSPIMTNAVATGSFKGSFSGSFEGDIQADSVAYANVTGKPTLVSGSSQIVFTEIAPNGIISGSASDARTQLGVAIGTDVQAYHQNLNDISGLNVSDSNFIVGNGSAFVAESGATARASLGLGDFATISSLAYADLTSIPSGIVSSSAQIDELFNVDGLISGSSLSSAAQGEVTLTTNGVAATATDLGLQTSDSPTFAGLTVNGAITVTGNVDGRDVAADGTKLDGIEANADVTDSTNVQAAGALMDSEVTNLAQVKAFNSADYATAAQGTTADAALPKAGGTMTGNITFSGAQTVDGRDLSADGTKLDGIEAGADVTDNANVTAAGALMDSELTSLSGVKTLTVPDNTTISTFGKSLVDDADAGAARTTLGVDAAGTDNSTDVTLAGTRDYITIAGQVITRNVIDISDDTNLAVSDTTGQTGINLTLSGDTISGVVSGLTTTSNVTFGSLTLSGDLTVNGDTVSLNATNLRVEDKLISLNRGGSTAASSDGGGFFLSGSNQSFTWDNGNTRWALSNSLYVPGSITVTGTVDGRDVAADGTKLDGIEAGATGDQTAAEIRTLVESATDSNVFTDADHSKLDGIAASANNYTHPSYTARSVDTTGAEVLDTFTSDTSGHVTAITKRTMTLADLGYSGATNADNYSSWTIRDGDTTTYTITSGDTLQIAAGTGITSNFTADDVLTITNTAPDQTVSLTAGSNVTITGTYPNFTIASTDTNTVYTHPSYTARSIDTAGAEVLDVFTSDTSGHVTSVTKRTMTLADLGYSGATNANYITNNNQLTNGAGYTTYSANQTLDNTSNVHFEGLMVGQTTGATANTIRCVGDIVAYYSSDAQFKDNVTQLEGALDKVKQIRGVSFDWNDKQDVYEGHDIGVIAQEVEAVYPELVHYREHNDSKAVDYVKLTAVLIEAVKELSAKVDALESKCNC